MRFADQTSLISPLSQVLMDLVIFVDIIVAVVEITLTAQLDDDEQEPEGDEWTFFWAFTLFALVMYTLELVLKLKGLGFSNFVKDRWNLMDALVVLLSACVTS